MLPFLVIQLMWILNSKLEHLSFGSYLKCCVLVKFNAFMCIGIPLCKANGETLGNVHRGCELVTTNWSFCVIFITTIWWTHENIMKPSEINMTFSHHLLFHTAQTLCSRSTSIVKCDHYGIQGHGVYHYYSLPPNLNSNNIGLGWGL